MLRSWLSVTLALGLLTGLSVFADSELDGKVVKTPSLQMKKLDPKAKIVKTYKVPMLEEVVKSEAFGKLSKEEQKKITDMYENVKPAVIAKLSKEEQKSTLEAFIKSVEIPANELSTEKVEQVAVASAPNSELDNAKSTAACGWRWRGNYGYGYGGGYYGGYNNYNTYYRPYYGYNFNSGFYNNNYYANNGCGFGNGGGCYNNYSYVDYSFYGYNNGCNSGYGYNGYRW